MRLCQRELLSRYRGSMIGAAWLVVAPLLSLTIYTLVFSVFLKVRWPSADDSSGHAALFVLLGLALYWFFAEAIGRAQGIIVENASYVTKIIFPLEVLPVSVTVASAVGTVLFGVLLLIAYMAMIGLPPLTMLLLPVVVAPFFVMTLGIAWMLASIGVFIRDLKHIVNFILNAMLFLAPVFYPVDRVPESLRFLVYLNPLTVPIELGRRVTFDGLMPDWWTWGLYVLVSAAVSSIGYVWFMRTKRGFADVL